MRGHASAKSEQISSRRKCTKNHVEKTKIFLSLQKSTIFDAPTMAPLFLFKEPPPPLKTTNQADLDHPNCSCKASAFALRNGTQDAMKSRRDRTAFEGPCWVKSPRGKLASVSGEGLPEHRRVHGPCIFLIRKQKICINTYMGKGGGGN